MTDSRALAIVGLCAVLITVSPCRSEVAQPCMTAQCHLADDGHDPLPTRMDVAWNAREAPNAASRLRALMAEARARGEPDYETTWRMARTLWWLAHIDPTPTIRIALAREAAAVAQRAIDHAPTRAEGHFAYAAAMGEYGANIGATRAVWEGVAGKFERAAFNAYARDRDFDHGAPMLALGRYYYVLPWPLRDLEKSRRFLEELTARHPNALLGRVWLAETLIALGEPARARVLLEAVLRSEDGGVTRFADQSTTTLARSALAEIADVQISTTDHTAPRS